VLTSAAITISPVTMPLTLTTLTVIKLL